MLNNNKRKYMLIVNYNTMKNYNEHNFKPNDKNQADALGWMLMATGINEIKEDNVSELLFRVRFMDFSWGKPYFTSNPNDEEIIQLFKRHVGLKIEITNRGMKVLNTRRRFMVNQLENMERRIERTMEKSN